MKYNLSKPIDKERYKTYCNRLYRLEKWVEVKEIRTKRTPSANRLYWAWLNCMGVDTGYTSEDMHSFYKKMFLEPKFIKLGLDGNMIEPTTTNLDTKDFSVYMDKVHHHASEEVGIYLPTLEDKLLDEFYKQFGE